MRAVLITGTSTGIGRAAGELFAEREWTVYAGSRSPEKLLFSHHVIKPVRIDVDDTSSIISCFEELKKQGVSLFHKRAYNEQEAKHVTEPWRGMYEGKKEGHTKSFSSPGRALPPEAVAKVIYRAATDGKRKLRYTVGNDTDVLLFFKKILPKQLCFELLHRKFMGR